jgi:hypothetical protein
MSPGWNRFTPSVRGDSERRRAVAKVKPQAFDERSIASRSHAVEFKTRLPAEWSEEEWAALGQIQRGPIRSRDYAVS